MLADAFSDFFSKVDYPCGLRLQCPPLPPQPPKTCVKLSSVFPCRLAFLLSALLPLCLLCVVCDSVDPRPAMLWNVCETLRGTKGKQHKKKRCQSTNRLEIHALNELLAR